MLALDSNVLIRYLTADDPAQFELAADLLEKRVSVDEPAFVSVVVLCETAWTLERFYGFGRNRIKDTVRRLLATPQVVFGDEAAVSAALEAQGDLVDALIHELGRAAGCSETVTFDRRFAQMDGVRLLGG